MCRGDDVDLGIAFEFFDEFVDQARINQRLVALNINYEREPFRFARDFRDSISPALVAP